MRARLLAVAALAAALAQPTAAQWSGDYQFHRSNDGRSLSVTVRGRIWFSDDDRDIVRIEDRGRLTIEERRRGFPDRMVVVAAGEDGQLERTYFVDGRRSQYGTAAAAWLSGLLPELIRESGTGAEERAQRILDRNGTDGLLDEVERIRSSSTRRRYLTVLLTDGRLSGSDGTRAMRAIDGISSSSDKATLLLLAAERLSLDSPTTRAAYFEAARSISSSSETRRALTGALAERPIPEPILIDAIGITRRISSGDERAAVLVLVAERHPLSTPALRDAFFGAADEISSSSQRRRVLVALLRAQGDDPTILRGVVRSARTISSDTEKAAVLMEVSARSVPPS